MLLFHSALLVEVYTGKNKSTGKQVAVKAINKDYVAASELYNLKQKIKVLKKVCAEH